jgi:hypothetical protein
MAAGNQRGVAGSLPPFLRKTYDIVSDPATDAVVSWSAAGTR